GGRIEVVDARGVPVADLDAAGGAVTLRPAPGQGVLRVERPGAPVIEQAVVPLGDVLVDRAGRSAGG
ncbi:MAG TPA: hypothetical protein VER97_02925, partial [Geodermatophilus sp.]|nr:hypothetical protein [Geodermatophilus sp.]